MQSTKSHDVIRLDLVFKCTHQQKDYYCNTCDRGFCFKCRKNHVVDLDTRFHDVTVHKERSGEITEDEVCKIHSGVRYEMWCVSCSIPICLKCKGHWTHDLLEIRTGYDMLRQEYEDRIVNIRSGILPYCQAMLTGRNPIISREKKDCKREIFYIYNDMIIKAEALKRQIDMVLPRVIRQFSLCKLQQNKVMNSLAIHKLENSCGLLINRPVQFLLFLKKHSVVKVKNFSNIFKQVCFSDKINQKDVSDLLLEIKIPETGKRQIGNEQLFKLMETAILRKAFLVNGISCSYHISCLSSNQLCVSDNNKLVFTDISSNILHQLSDIESGRQVHAATNKGDLIYIDKYYDIKKLYTVDYTTSSLLKTSEPWRPWCLHSSLLTEDLLVLMRKRNEDVFDYTKAKVTRIKGTGEHIQTIQYQRKGIKLYSRPVCITENSNGDVIVSDYDCGVVVTDYGGRYRFSYTGPPLGSQLLPQGICTDSLSNILVSDRHTFEIQLIDKDGSFLLSLQTSKQGIGRPWSLTYDYKNQLLWIGSNFNNRVCAYRYIEQQDYIKGNDTYCRFETE
ncbi:uncharacterized protein LOC133195009 [Saccostrea echinata]|uniref:uncharacterized protein LOC133195009 n=1 Tax=Saccostrea echinata TaxID=191078 RepID=UPI002A7F9973|nr:uncharacterized protein LOC133195009 [Saccostrea echinata]